MFKLECAKNIERDVLNLGLHCEGINLVREYQTDFFQSMWGGIQRLQDTRPSAHTKVNV